MPYYELNLDGLVGPTHNYAGLSFGNLASTKHVFLPSNPKAAALQGLEKMRLLHKAGLKQGILLPHQRPNISLLEQFGFSGTLAQKLEKAYREAPEILSACFSASSMWAANAATVSASADTADGRVHFTPANLLSNLHRHQETEFSGLLLRKMFSNPEHFVHHPPIPSSRLSSDEGAANHNRLCAQHSKPGIALFVYGTEGQIHTTKFPTRQTLLASKAIARSHLLNPDSILFAKQSPAAIDAGVFHNDVIAVANEYVFLTHEQAYVEQRALLEELEKRAHFPLRIMEIPTKRISLASTVQSYFFNSQLVTLPNQEMALISPVECEQNPKILSFIEEFIADSTNPISQVHFLDLKQSMQNGGGPACLRLRVPLSTNELNAMYQPILLNENLIQNLSVWINKHYRDRLEAPDLRDPFFVEECYIALEELANLLKMGSIYPFQQN